jgi:hypothetical protein
MNPYLEREAVFHDFHESFMPLAREILSSQVRPRYFVKIDEHIYIHEPEEPRQLIGRGDLLVSEGTSAAAAKSGVQLLEAPAQVRQPVVDTERVSYLEIRERENRDRVAVLELLRRSNKYRGPDRDQYLAKRGELLATTAHFIEIDLLRGGPGLPWLDLPECDYYVVVSRMERRPHAGIWPIKLRDRLPEIPVPLKEGDADATLDLQQVLDRIYDAAGYEDYVYASPPEPPLSKEDAAWAKEQISSRNE